MRCRNGERSRITSCGSASPGDVVQIDTITIDLAPGRTIKHFDAYDVFAKWTVAKTYRRATAANAPDFLAKVVAEMPWPPKAIQIDGGAEFMAEFEQACMDRNIPLYVLPPRSPKLNGAVERCNGAWRYEFYAATELPNQLDKIADHVDAFQHLYNHHRPPRALDGLTPNEYLKICLDRMAPAVSYVLSADSGLTCSKPAAINGNVSKSHIHGSIFLGNTNTGRKRPCSQKSSEA